MKTNFDFLLKEPQFEPFAEAAISAERVLHISPAAVRYGVPHSVRVCCKMVV